MKKLYWTIFILALFAGFIWMLSGNEEDEISASVSVAEAMGGGDEEEYLRATGPREFVFPDDHGPHPGFRTEWWYYTGNVFTEEGRQFGYQFTIFRSQLTPPDSTSEDASTQNNWNTNQLYLGHFAISDVAEEDHIFEERYSRGAAGLAGAQVDPYRIWLEDWEIRRVNPNGSDDKDFPVRIKAKMEDGASIDFTITPSKPLVLQGEDGYDRKGEEEGNASYYLAFTRMDTEGTITKDGEEFDISGSSWMDHEWSTSALDESQEGWDWFSIQLSNGYDLMYYQLRNDDGTVSTFTTGSLIDPAGNKTTITPEDVELEVQDTWLSPHSGAEYPSQWTMRIPRFDLQLDLATLFPDQEMDVSVRYFEGTLSVSGNMEGKSLGGNGFIEMTGYGEN
ncbi:lipocalin-like domain-containing protein [Gracilimonas mengyeensis]|uniref:Predicted secreted hydrolase n=1 Tax=Gracilimonas mengyeensis TaxID=1302730 RepID=A0A521BFL8_9BACT|nr:lipocalin-like domain-containing protein [Gracilimonas mengyeensis]SMO45863.1 Predicted secreted hydrolase [Gracilimonas mengyeensis]